MTYFIQPEWPAPTHIKAFSSLRHVGNSLAPYDSFNVALNVEDQHEAVQNNRRQLRQLLELPAEPIWLKQTHSTRVLEALPCNRELEADASFTRESGQVCAIVTADCLPILLCDQTGHHAAAIHAGWRGLAKGIIANTLEKLALDNHSLLAWLGPAIGPQKYEVGEEVFEIFKSLDDANQLAFKKTSPTTWLANLYELARLQLRALGVGQIFGGQFCTYTDQDKFFSYRRDKGKTGRMASLIWLEG